MLLKKGFREEEKNGVQMGKGSVSFQGVKLNVYAYVIDGVLIDTGAKSLEKQFKPFLEKHDYDKVVITHHHEDHTGCAALIQNIKNVPIYMDDTFIDYCTTIADYPLYRRIFWGKRTPFRAKAIGKTFTSRNATWDVIETPGHAYDHLSFLNRETGQLFTGDLYVQEKTKVALRDESIPTIINSLKKVLTYDFDEMFCSHAGYIKNGRKRIQQKIDYLEELQAKIIILKNEGLTPSQINKKLFPRKYPITFISSGEWGSIHIVHSVFQNN